jgi:hypothetical protein
MKNQVYFEKIIKILKELKKDHPDVDVSKHYSLATDDSNFTLSDKELFYALQKHKAELDMNTLSDKDFDKVIAETEELFKESEYDETLDAEIDEDY